MFEAVPLRYDGINRLMTLGLDQRWRHLAARRILAGSPERILDLGAGTGDLSLLLASRNENPSITAADFSRPMLDLLQKRTEDAGLGKRIKTVEADAAELPFADSSFDAVGIAFAFRNLLWKNPNREKHLAEILRVLRPGGRFVAVETSQPGKAFWRGGFHLWMRAVAGPLGGLLSGQKAAYRYLAKSASNFYRPDEIRDMLLGAGFSKVEQETLFGGVAAIHTAIK